MVDALIGGLSARAARLLRLVHDAPGLTRAEAARLLGVGSGAVSELTETLRRASLLSERPAPATGRGRPTRQLVAHPGGPLVLAAAPWRAPEGENRGEPFRWRVHAVELGGRPVAASFAADLSDAVDKLVTRLGSRIRAAAAAGGTEVTADFPISGGEAAFAAVAEARRGAARGATLHLHVDRRSGASLTARGRPLAGDPGHLPFGDPAVRCFCGSGGCWISGATPLFGRGIAGLVNGFGVEVVTVAGIDVSALTIHYRAGLTSARRTDPPPLLPAALGDDGPLLGASETAWSALLARRP